MRISISFDQAAEIYDKTRSLPSEVMKRLIETLSIELKGCSRILDVGVGTGRFSEPLQKLGFEVAGIDISRKMASKAKEKGVKNLILADARSLPFSDKVFDATISVHLLHLVKEWQDALAEVGRVTRYAMLSLCYAHENPVREKYDLLLKPYGYERHRPGKSEQDLRDLVTPTKTVFICSYCVSLDDTITNLEQGTSSSQWEIPKQVNLEAVKKLKTEFAGETFMQDLYLSVWEMESLWRISETQPARTTGPVSFDKL